MVMSKKTFQVGDIVQLKSGGPDMCVDNILGSNNTIARCSWFAGKKLEQGSFPFDTLNPVDKGASGKP